MQRAIFGARCMIGEDKITGVPSGSRRLLHDGNFDKGQHFRIRGGRRGASRMDERRRRSQPGSEDRKGHGFSRGLRRKRAFP